MRAGTPSDCSWCEWVLNAVREVRWVNECGSGLASLVGTRLVAAGPDRCRAFDGPVVTADGVVGVVDSKGMTLKWLAVVTRQAGPRKKVMSPGR